MLKSVQGRSAFGSLLKDTKISQLQASIGNRELNANNGFPTHQIIEAPASSFSRRDFGLKMRIPKKIKTRRIIINDLDNKYGLPNFEKLNGDYFKKLRFQELGIPVSATYTAEAPTRPSAFNSNSKDAEATIQPSQNPLFSSSKQSASSQTIASLLHIKNQPLQSTDFVKDIKPRLQSLRKPFLQWVAKNYPDELSKPSVALFKLYVESEKPQLFNDNKNYIPSTYANALSGTAGLSYNLKGRLFQTPKGSKTSRIVPGRIVSKQMNAIATVGGFVGNVRNTSANDNYVKNLALQNRVIEEDKFAREFKIPATVDRATLILDSNSLGLNVTPVTTANNSRSKVSSRSRSAQVASAQIEDLLSLLQNSPSVKGN